MQHNYLDFDLKDDDELENAPEFRIMRGVFNSENDRLMFNKIANDIKEQILEVMKLLIDETSATRENMMILEKFHLLNKKEQESLIKKVQKTSDFIGKDKNLFKFYDLVKQVLINLLYGSEIGH